MSEAFTMREPCRRCQHAGGRIEPRNGQDCVFCAACGAFCYNAPRTETGREVRSVSTVHAAIKPKQRARVLVRAHGLCEICHKAGAALHVGHFLSVEEGLKLGLTDQQINSDDNLAAICDECNLGMGSDPVPIWLLVAILKARSGLGA